MNKINDRIRKLKQQTYISTSTVLMDGGGFWPEKPTSSRKRSSKVDQDHTCKRSHLCDSISKPILPCTKGNSMALPVPLRAKAQEIQSEQAESDGIINK